MASSVQPFLCDKYGSEVEREWLSWKRNFHYFIEANEIVDVERKKTLLLLFAGEQIQEIYDNLDGGDDIGGPRPSEYMDQYKVLVTRLDSYFASKINVTVERTKFQELKQEANETIAKFAMRLRNHAKRCNFGEQLDSNIRDRILVGWV